MPIDLRDAAFSYPDGSSALSGVTIRIDDGERVAIVGQNGAGKTTTVKLMNGLLKPTTGDVIIDGLSTSGRAAAIIALVAVFTL